jgi:hypothetical protein
MARFEAAPWILCLACVLNVMIAIVRGEGYTGEACHVPEPGNELVECDWQTGDPRPSRKPWRFDPSKLSSPPGSVSFLNSAVQPGLGVIICQGSWWCRLVRGVKHKLQVGEQRNRGHSALAANRGVGWKGRVYRSGGGVDSRGNCEVQGIRRCSRHIPGRTPYARPLVTAARTERLPCGGCCRWCQRTGFTSPISHRASRTCIRGSLSTFGTVTQVSLLAAPHDRVLGNPAAYFRERCIATQILRPVLGVGEYAQVRLGWEHHVAWEF